MDKGLSFAGLFQNLNYNYNFIVILTLKLIFLFFFQLETLGGEFVTISKNPDTNKVRVFSLAGEANVKVSNIKTKFGLVHVVDTVLM
mgnify:CR=1 FL=1